MIELKYTPVSEIPQIRNCLNESFRRGVSRPLEWRRNQIYQLARLVQENADAFAAAQLADMGKPKLESASVETGTVVERCLKTASQLDQWTEPEHPHVPDWQKSWSPTLHKSPRGVVLIIAPWNYPLILTLQPLLGAIAAGCCAVVKPSEVSPAYASLLAELLPKYLDNSAYRVVNGAVEEATTLLGLQWDYIFYTGNSKVARVVAAAAAKHLTPLSLELGGKSPVIVDPSYDMKLAAKRILWGKTNNAGQERSISEIICVAPDYVLIPRVKQDEFVAALKEHHDVFFPEGALKSSSYGRIINALHHERLRCLLAQSRGKIAFGGKFNDQNGFEPTIVTDVKANDSLLEVEIFGPILPIVPIDSMAEAIEFVNARSHPLVLYAFTDDALLKDQIIQTTRSGGLVFNDTFMQLAVSELPFNGVGESGYGYQTMKYTFDAFTQLRSSVDFPKEAEPFMQARYPPYTDENLKVMTATVHLKIPML